MENRKIVHEIKLQKSVIIILGVMAFGIIGITFKGYVTSADAYHSTLSSTVIGTQYHPVHVKILS